jgi:hypothetical protein
MKPEHIEIAEQIARDASCAQGEFNQRVLSIIPYLTDVCDRASLVGVVRTVCVILENHGQRSCYYGRLISIEPYVAEKQTGAE